MVKSGLIEKIFSKFLHAQPFSIKWIYLIERRRFNQKYKFKNKYDMVCAWSNFQKNVFGMWYDKWNFKPQISSIFHFDRVSDVELLKVEKILKCSLNLIPSPSLKIQIMGGKVCLRMQQTFYFRKFVDNILNFHWRWWDWMHAIFLNLFYFTY